MRFLELSSEHADELLKFELENKAWFESFIEPRDPSFYSPIGVAKHIQELEKRSRKGTAFSAVVLQDNAIIARANLKDLNTLSAYIGYRVSETHTSMGVATLGLHNLIKIAKSEFNLYELNALVLENNPASKRVLLKQGFKKEKHIQNFTVINNQMLSCNLFSLKLRLMFKR